MIFTTTWLVLFLIETVQASCDAHKLVVTTNSGTYTGKINDTAPDVRQFLSIPFGVPPVGDLRWEPPQKPKTDSNHKVDATNFPRSCPQFVSKLPAVYNQDVPEWSVFNDGQSDTAGESSLATSEDCLYLAVWAPTGNKTGLPVIIFMTGGGFNTGGVNVPIQLPYHWVQRTQSHIVVTINYRVNIFGFPNAAGLETQNLGLLDQRMALEWVRDNIEAFGGDPTRITLWGQSAGAISADYQNFAYPSDPIAQGFFMQSGSVYLDVTSSDFSNFTFVAKSLGCDNDTAADEVDCMRQLPFDTIENFVGQFVDNMTSLAFYFHPFPDEKLVFKNYTARYAEPNSYANKPTIYSFTANEGVGLVQYPKDPSKSGPNQTQADLLTLGGFHCAAALSSQLRTKYHPETPTYRYEFMGNFSNVSPRFWMGAYHASDLAFIFGTHQDLPGADGKGSTEFEFSTSEAMEDYVLAFANDPKSPKIAGTTNWPSYADDGIVQFGLMDTKVAAQIVKVEDVDSVCKSLLA